MADDVSHEAAAQLIISEAIQLAAHLQTYNHGVGVTLGLPSGAVLIYVPPGESPVVELESALEMVKQAHTPPLDRKEIH